MDEPQRVPGAERGPARGQLIQHRAQRVQVGPLIRRPAGPPGRLRRQVRQRPGDLGMVRELRAELGERRSQGEVHQARSTVTGNHDVRRGDVTVDHPPPVHPRHRPGQPHPETGQLTGRQRLGQARQARPAGVRQHDRPGVPRRLRQLRHPRDAAQAFQHRGLMPHPAFRVRSQRLLADDRAPGEEQPGDARALAGVHDLGPEERIRAGPHAASACSHRAPPHTARPPPSCLHPG